MTARHRKLLRFRGATSCCLSIPFSSLLKQRGGRERGGCADESKIDRGEISRRSMSALGCYLRRGARRRKHEASRPRGAEGAANSHGLHLKITSTHSVRRPESKRVQAVKTGCRVIRQQAAEDRRQADGKVRHKTRQDGNGSARDAI
jgi:hypothetical protein